MSSDPPFRKTVFSERIYASDIVDAVKRNIVRGEVGEKVLNWQCSPQDMELIGRIVERGMELWVSQGIALDKNLAHMDIACCHCNGCPLELIRFLMCDVSDFVHDFSGIGQHIDRASGRLLNDFRPIFRKVLQ